MALILQANMGKQSASKANTVGGTRGLQHGPVNASIAKYGFITRYWPYRLAIRTSAVD